MGILDRFNKIKSDREVEMKEEEMRKSIKDVTQPDEEFEVPGQEERDIDDELESEPDEELEEGNEALSREDSDEDNVSNEVQRPTENPKTETKVAQSKEQISFEELTQANIQILNDRLTKIEAYLFRRTI